MPGGEREEFCMAEIITPTPTPKTAAEYEAAVDALLAEMARMNERSEQTWAEIEQLKAETKLIKERTDVLKAHTQAQLGELLARFG
jgi:K+/H+ antiporter YhaU regulatory subunit KhtT